MHIFYLIIFFILFLTRSISILFTKKFPIEITPYFPEFLNKNIPKKRTIAIMYTNDIHGYFFPKKSKIPENKSRVYEVGGMEYLSSYSNILRSEFKDNFIWLDGGDIFQGGFETKLSNGTLMTKYFNYENVSASTIGNHEWDYGQNYLKERLKESNFPYIVSNIFSTSTKSNKVFQNQITYKIFDINHIKIGVIGITTLYTRNTTKGDLHGIKIIDYEDIVKQYTKLLKKDFGVNAVILLFHGGLTCKKNDKTKDILKLKLWNVNNSNNYCDGYGELAIFLKNYFNDVNNNNNISDEFKIDLILSAHTHAPNHYFFNYLPVVANINNGKYFSVVYLSFDENGKLNSNDVNIESPIPVCSEVFSEAKQCDLKTLGNKDNFVLGEIRKFNFHGITIEKNKNVINEFYFFRNLTKQYEQMKIIKINSDLYTEKLKETPLGNFLSDFMRNHTDSDVAIVNSGVCRSMWQKGTVNGKMVEDMFPFEDSLTSVSMTGKELIKTLEIIQTGTNQIFEVSNLIQFMDKKKKKLINVTFADGSKIDENKVYKVAVTYFLLPNYGDEFNGIKSFYPHVKDLELYGDYTPLIFHHLQEMKELNVEDYFNDKKLRMNFV